MKISRCASALCLLWLAGCANSPVAQTPTAQVEAPPKDKLSERVAYYADHYEVPETLVRRSIQLESNFNPNGHNGPYWGLMQLRLATARGLGYHGSAPGLLDADTNLKYAVAYLSNAYVVADGNPDRALRLYASGYYFEARRKGLLDRLRTAED